MEYYKKILNSLLDIYERREVFAKNDKKVRVIKIKPAKEFKEYTNQYNYTTYREINVAIEKLLSEDLIQIKKDASGQYIKVQMCVNRVEDIYAILKRVSVPQRCDVLRKIIDKVDASGKPLLEKYCIDQITYLDTFKKLPFGVEYDSEKLQGILKTLTAILELKSETYVRNFSTAIFKDSKLFQKIKSSIQSILYEYTDLVVEKERILERYNLFNNPTYVMIKGNATIRFNKSLIELNEIKGGIALPSKALAQIESFIAGSDKLITVENLTTYHDTKESEGVIIYLGGFHNEPKQKLLELIYAENKEKEYFHKGDLDVFGFAILENLKEKTKIPFMPLEMDVATLEKFYLAGLYKNLTLADKKAMKSDKLNIYRDILNYMLEHDCKIEQESFQALELIDKAENV